MPVLVLGIVKQIAFGWLGKLASKKFIEWALLSVAEQYVKSTKTPADDKWFEKIKGIVGEDK